MSLSTTGWSVEWGIVCDRGSVRVENQDAAFLWLASEVVRFPTLDPTERVAGGCSKFPSGDRKAAETRAHLLALVADGMGGPPGGAQASQTIVETTAAAMEQAEALDPSAFLDDLVAASDRAVYAEAEAHGLLGMGSTCTILLFTDAGIHLCHVGDSRCYRIRPRKDSMVQWSRDQNVASELVEQGVLTPEEARNHRSSHTLTQAVGLGKPLMPQIEAASLPAEEEIFLLCSDGLLRVVEEWEILRTFASGTKKGKGKKQRAGEGSGPGMRASAERLVDLANRRGSPDNVSVLVLRLQPPAEPSE